MPLMTPDCLPPQVRDDLTAVIEAPSMLAVRRLGALPPATTEQAASVVSGMQAVTVRTQRRVHSSVRLAECRVQLGWMHGGSAYGEWTVDGVLQAAARRGAWESVHSACTAWESVSGAFTAGWDEHCAACLSCIEGASDAVVRVVNDAANAAHVSAEAVCDELRRVISQTISEASRPLEREARRVAALLASAEAATKEEAIAAAAEAAATAGAKAAFKQATTSTVREEAKENAPGGRSALERAEWQARQELLRKREASEARRKEEAAEMMRRRQHEEATRQQQRQ